ncbi:MAG: HYR domain-containing protein [candidate division Zixibacteria bacterium]|nr:HYR domain-containing protein [candidate division Zixibacteria bacterium]
MSIAPAAQMTWDELVAIDKAKAALPGAPSQAIPFMEEPADRDIGFTMGLSPQPDHVATPAYSPRVLLPPLKNSFQALPDNNRVIPPDTHGAVSKSYTMTMLNSQVRIQNRFGATISTVSLAAFWVTVGSTGLTDPRIMYDPATNRWLATVLADVRTATASFLFAISANSNPTGSWTFYRVDVDPTDVNWADYDDLGFNDTWIAVTANMYTVAASLFSGTAMWVINKSTALAGGSLTLTSFPVGSDSFGGFDGFTLRVCQTFGPEPTLYIVDNPGWSSAGVNLLRLTQITGTAAAPIWSATPGSDWAGSGLFAVNNSFSPQINAPQLGTATLISTNDRRMLNAVFRNGHVWCTHSGGLPVGAVDRTAAFWYQLDPTALPAPIVQSGVLDGGSGVHHFFPSISVNINDDAFIGFTRSDATRYAEAVYTGRLGTDPLGTMDPISLLKAGEASYVKDFGSGRVRWGDYSATLVDPIDDVSFWTIQEYAAMDVGPTANDDRWGTWWGRVSSGPANNPPTAICRNVTVNASFSCLAAVFAAAVNNGSSDPEDGTNVTLALLPPGPFPLGVTAVDLVVTDTQGGSDTCSALITVEDHTAPVITCPAPMTVNNTVGQCGATVNFTPTATDNCPGASIVSTPPSGTVFPIGVTPVMSIASDASGNMDTCQFTVTVRDTERPVVLCHADTIVDAPPGQSDAIVIFGSSATDNCPGAVVVCTPPSGSAFPGGVTHVICIATDAAGNKDTCGFNITVNLCVCLHQGDIAVRPTGDGMIDVFDIIEEIGIAFSGATDPQDPQCPRTRGDVDNNGISDVFDVLYLIATAFGGGPNPVDPCTP